MVPECVQHISVNVWFQKNGPDNICAIFFKLWGMLNVNVYSNSAWTDDYQKLSIRNDRL